MASKRRNWLMRQARKENGSCFPKNGGFPAYWMHDAKYGNRAPLDRARGRDKNPFRRTPVYGFCRFIEFIDPTINYEEWQEICHKWEEEMGHA